MMNGKEKDQEFGIEEGRRKSKRKKQPVEQIPQKKSRRTRGKVKQSSQQYALPQNIPISDSQELKRFDSFERETTKIIFQIPLHLFKNDKMKEYSEVRVESTVIQIQIAHKDSETICFQAKIQSQNKEQQQEERVFSIWGKGCWVSPCEVSTKIVKQAMKSITDQYNEICKLKCIEVNSDIFVVLNFREKVQCTTEYNGLINQGNTCYMNSYLQMLNHISQFRNLVFDAEVQDQNKFPATLQILFYRLGNDQKAVSAESLVKSFGWSKKQAQIQQDAQEFSCLFFEVLEKKLLEVCHKSKHLSMSQLFQGRLLHYIECTNVEYRSNKDERFFDIQLNITANLENSLDEYVSEQILSGDNMYDTEIYGKQQAKKGVRIEVLPPILMIQLKRFQFSPITYQNEKVMERFEYPNEINFSKWLLSGSQQVYQLYGVLVHEGAKAESGHYYAYLNVKEGWYKFNDQEVTKVHERNVFQYNFGGSIDAIELDSRQMSVKMRKMVSSSTAYMLVYVKKSLKQDLLSQQTIYPEWLKERDILKMQERQQQKARKNFYHDIQVLTWQKDFEGKLVNEIGLIPKSREGFKFQDLGRINKNQKIKDWLQKFNNDEIGAYLHINCPDKTEYECLINLQGKTGSFQDTIRESYNPVIIFAPFIVKAEEYLIIVKLNLIEEVEEMKFSEIMNAQKTSTNSSLVKSLKQKYDEQGYETKFYFEQKKQLSLIKPNGGFLLSPASVRNCMLIVIVEKIKSEYLKKDIQTTQQWYSRQQNTVDITVKSEDGSYELYITIDQHKSVQDLRNLIFEERLADDESYASPENIIIKSKQKKTSKIYSEQEGLKTVKDLIRGCDKQKIIMFCPSTLKVDERISQMQIKVRYRYRDLTFSDPLNIILNKQFSNDEHIFYKKLSTNETIKKYLKNQGGKDIRMLIFTKDFYQINDLISKNGYILGKGQINSILQKQKGINLIVQAKANKNDDETICPLFLHHESLTANRIGKPRYFEVPRTIKLSKLRQQIIELIKDEEYEWQEKVFPLNSSKISILAFVKDSKKAIELIENVEQMQVIEIKDQDKNKQEVIEIEDDQEKKQSEDENGAKEDKNGQKLQQKTLQKAFPKSKLVKILVRHFYLTRAQNPMKINIQ